jgi:hypothetical protein
MYLQLNVLQLNEKQEQPCLACGAGRALEMKTLSFPLDAQTHPSQPIPLHQLQMPSSTNNKVCFVFCYFFYFLFLGGGGWVEKKACDWQPLVAKHALRGFLSWNKNNRRIPAFFCRRL